MPDRKRPPGHAKSGPIYAWLSLSLSRSDEKKRVCATRSLAALHGNGNTATPHMHAVIPPLSACASLPSLCTAPLSLRACPHSSPPHHEAPAGGCANISAGDAPVHQPETHRAGRASAAVVCWLQHTQPCSTGSLPPLCPHLRVHSDTLALIGEQKCPLCGAR